MRMRGTSRAGGREETDREHQVSADGGACVAIAGARAVTNLTVLLTIMVAIILVTIFTCYAASVWMGHVPAIFPYISETGTKPPESCIFGLGLNLASFLYFFAVYLRHYQIETLAALFPGSRIAPTWGRVATAIGLTSALGLSVLANFQVSNGIVPHMIGAVACFVGGSIYFALQAWFSQRLSPMVCSPQTVRLRVALGLLSCIAFLICFAAAAFAMPQYDGDDPHMIDWRPEHKAYAAHCLSTAAEWVGVLLFVGSIVTYIPEMRSFTLRPPTFEITGLATAVTSCTTSTAPGAK